MSRGVGQHRTPVERAQDQLVTQQQVVAKTQQKRDNAVEQLAKYQILLDEANTALHLELELLKYYEAHPLLKQQEEAEPTLPLEEVFKGLRDTSTTPKYRALGIGGRHVEGDQ